MLTLRRLCLLGEKHFSETEPGAVPTLESLVSGGTIQPCAQGALVSSVTLTSCNEGGHGYITRAAGTVTGQGWIPQGWKAGLPALHTVLFTGAKSLRNVQVSPTQTPQRATCGPPCCPLTSLPLMGRTLVQNTQA